ncbi:MAG: hypothetical protein KGJ86_00470, partial [Chloroflexota bacterium]|nr:hypothetical protein [Chloroflexota bacterium]
TAEGATMADYLPFGEWLLEARKRLRVSQRVVGERAGVAHPTLSGWERHGREPRRLQRRAVERAIAEIAAERGIVVPTSPEGGVK